MSIQIQLPNGAIKEYAAGVSMEEVAGSISSSLKKQAVAGKVDGKVMDLSHKLEHNAKVEIVTLDSSEGLEVYRHSTAHLLAQALKRIYGGTNVKLGIGPVIEDGFYYDIDLDRPVSSEDLGRIEQEMAKIAQENWPVKRREVSREEALRLFGELDDPLKLELIRDLPEEAVITIYEQGEFFDLCRGPHLPSTGRIKAFKLLSVAGAYWRGDSNNKMLQRIYGTAFPTKAQLDEHLAMLEEAKRRDHRRIGKELELFMFSEEAPGMPFYLPKGTIVRNELEQFSRGHFAKLGYDEVRTPLMMNRRLWEQSGHWDHYRDNMYFSEVDDASFALKPMNCPGHMLVYKNTLRSYRDLPIRMAEFGQVHRHEFSGALSGMMRVRTFCQDDAHIFARLDQLEEEIGNVIDLIDGMYKVFGFEYAMELSTRPEQSMGTDEQWEKAEAALRNVLHKRNVQYRLNEGDGAFYGPKIDFHIRDAIKRSWQCATIQVDFQFPEKFDLTYVDEANAKVRPVVIHRAVYGSVDRFIGILTEHFAGAFPVWLSPVQAVVVPVSDIFADQASAIVQSLIASGVRAEADLRSEKLGYKIRAAQLAKTPYMLIVGEQEAGNGTVAVRHRDKGDIGSFLLDSFVCRITEEIRTKAKQ
ncbi:threonine--tRNA ligase [Paenibacillus ginsengarvi]|uniref:Threonine--tRNA ligase n=1 Tax=Paenibacillus ginsengarvi TaxID=400777 RepID=A0A3B0BMC0_9BACL|nr:threonine--tRNA ligase [Paenibacillus ginsengarvi]RKN74220.1 threonine--tRNA ligase [Paenibacillus ginsengarvi]